MKAIVRIVFLGYVLLISAVVINYSSAKVGLLSWYDYLHSGLLINIKFVDLLWLFLGYPILLGIVVYLSNEITKRFDKFSGRKTAVVLISFFLILTSIIFALHSQQKVKIQNIKNFEECQTAGFPITESYPERCHLPDGRSFEHDLLDEEVACTMDVMECPDGSYVGRVVPDCEFLPCR